MLHRGKLWKFIKTIREWLDVLARGATCHTDFINIVAKCQLTD